MKIKREKVVEDCKLVGNCWSRVEGYNKGDKATISWEEEVKAEVVINEKGEKEIKETVEQCYNHRINFEYINGEPTTIVVDIWENTATIPTMNGNN